MTFAVGYAAAGCTSHSKRKREAARNVAMHSAATACDETLPGSVKTRPVRQSKVSHEAMISGWVRFTHEAMHK